VTKPFGGNSPLDSRVERNVEISQGTCSKDNGRQIQSACAERAPFRKFMHALIVQPKGSRASRKLRILYLILRTEGLRIALSIGLVDSYEHAVVRGIVRYAREQSNWNLYGAGWMFRGLGSIDSWDGDGIIARAESEEQALRLAATGIPVVDVAGAYRVQGLFPVTSDDFASGRLAGDYFAGAGFTSFAFCGVADVGWSRKRREGFIAAVGPQVRRFEESLPWWERPEEFGRLDAWIHSLPRRTAVFACNDTAGIKVTALCRRLHIAVPKDLAVLGIDNEEILCELSDPPLSSIPLDCEQIGYRAAAELRRLIEEAQATPHSRRSRPPGNHGALPAVFPVIPPHPIVERASTQTIPATDITVHRAAEFIREHAARRVLVPEIARQVNLSRRALEIRFRAATGRTVHQEIVRVRMQHAAALLRDTDLPIRAVAELCGIGTPQRFYAQFAAAEACTPAEYRRRHRR